MTGKVVLITGAAGALGQGVVRATLDAGHSVVAVDRVRLDTSALSMERFHAVEGDALSPVLMDSAVRSTQQQFGRLDALFHLAGTYACAPLADTPPDLWQRLLNVTSAYVAARATLPALRDSRGLMAFVGAQAALSAPANQSAYNASKAALLTFARTLSAASGTASPPTSRPTGSSSSMSPAST